MEGGARVSDRERRSVEFELPEPIVQHIQSFLTWKEAARTTLLSKSWYASWSTRPSLCLDEVHFYFTENQDGLFISNFPKKLLDRYPQIYPETYNSQSKRWYGPPPACQYFHLRNRNFFDAGGFCTFALSALQRYSQLNRKVDNFELRYTSIKDEVSAALADELIINALKLGVTDLTLRLYCSYVLPVQVFSSSSLTNVSISNCKIDHSLTAGIVLWSRLASLTLSWVDLGDDAICDILTACPLIENLELYHCSGHKSLHISSHSLKYLDLRHLDYDSLRLDVPNLCQFRLSCSSVRLLSFSTDLKDCESYISFRYPYDLDASWSLELREFLKELKRSKIFLHGIFCREITVSPDDDITCLSMPEVENLILHKQDSLSCENLVRGLLWSCHPKFILLECGYLPNQSSLYRSLKQKLLCLPALEEVIVEVYDSVLQVWKPTLWNDLAHGWEKMKYPPRIGFHLKWRDTNESIYTISAQ